MQVFSVPDISKPWSSVIQPIAEVPLTFPRPESLADIDREAPRRPRASKDGLRPLSSAN